MFISLFVQIDTCFCDAIIDCCLQLRQDIAASIQTPHHVASQTLLRSMMTPVVVEDADQAFFCRSTDRCRQFETANLSGCNVNYQICHSKPFSTHIHVQYCPGRHEQQGFRVQRGHHAQRGHRAQRQMRAQHRIQQHRGHHGGQCWRPFRQCWRQGSCQEQEPQTRHRQCWQQRQGWGRCITVILSWAS